MAETPRILFIGDLNFYSKGASRLKSVERLGAEVRALSHAAVGDQSRGYVPPSLAFRIGWKLGFHVDEVGVNAKTLAAVRDFRPDVVWIEKGNMFRPATLAAIHAIHPAAVICSYTDDDMFNRLNNTWYYRRGLKHYDIVFSTKSFNANPDELPALGARRVVLVDKAYDADQHAPIDITDDERVAYGADVGFIGSFEAERAESMAHIARAGFQVRIWGNGWDGFAAGGGAGIPTLQVECKPLMNAPGDFRYTKGIRATTINLGFLRKENRDLQTDRSVEIPACEAFMLAEYSDEHARLFTPGAEADYFIDRDDMVAKVRHYLAHPDACRRIAAAGRKRAVDGGYSLDDRMRAMIDTALGR